jgi:hypothetical protein
MKKATSTSDCNKPYDLTFETRNGFLFARVKAPGLTSETKAAYLKEVADKCAEVDCNGVVIHRDITGPVVMGAIYPVVEQTLKNFGTKPLAFVNPPGTGLAFFTLAYEKLGGRIRVFDGLHEAEYWLATAHENN